MQIVSSIARSLAPSLLAGALLASPALASNLSDAMMRAGLDPEALAASGVVSGDVAGIAADVETYLDANPTSLSNADTAFVEAKQQVDELRRLVQSGTASEQEVDDLATWKATLATAETTRAAVLNAIFAAGIADLAQAKRDALTTIRANRPWALPIEFLAKNHTEAQWVALRDALAAESMAIAEGASVDPTCAALLLAERADEDVAAAKTAFDTHHASVATAWASAVES